MTGLSGRFGDCCEILLRFFDVALLKLGVILARSYTFFKIPTCLYQKMQVLWSDAMSTLLKVNDISFKSDSVLWKSDRLLI